MSPFLRKVPTTSVATAVHIEDESGGKSRIVERPGSAHMPEDLATLVEVSKAKARDPEQATLEFDIADKPRVALGIAKSRRSGIPIDTTRRGLIEAGFRHHRR